MIYLGLTDGQAIPEGYDRYIWASEGCTEGIDWCKKNGIEYQIVPRTWKDDEDVYVFETKIGAIKELVLEYCAAELNIYHQSKYSLEQWKIVLSFWLDCFLISIYDKYARLKKIADMNIECECFIYEKGQLPVPDDYLEFLNIAWKDEFHLYLYSELLSLPIWTGNIHVRHSGVCCLKKNSAYTFALPIRKKLLYDGISAIKKFFHIQDKLVLNYMNLTWKITFPVMLKSGFKVSNSIRRYMGLKNEGMIADTDVNWRCRDRIIEREDFLSVVKPILLRNIPKSYAEAFPQIRKLVFKRFRNSMHPKAVYTAAGISWDDVYKVYLMHVKKNNPVFFGIQHGGNYGIETFPKIRSEYELNDVEYTWGWHPDSPICGCEFRAMPAVRLMSSRLNKVKEGDRILYISYTMQKHICDLVASEIFYDIDRQDEYDFLKNLDTSVKDKLIVRCYQDDYDWKPRRETLSDIQGLRFDEYDSFDESLNQANLVVMMIWSTTILQAMYANKPVIVRAARMNFEQFARNDIHLLQNVGIVVTSFEELQNQVEMVAGNITKWWNEPKRQKAIRYFKKKYIKVPKNANALWRKELSSWL